MQSTNSPSFVIHCEEDGDGNLIIPFPEELLEALGWTDGTNLDIQVLPGCLSLREVEPVQTGVGASGRTESVTKTN